MTDSSFYQSKRRETGEEQNMREFTVGEPDFVPSELPQGYVLSPDERNELHRLRQEKSKSSGLNDHAKKRVELLAGIGRLTKDVQIDGISFSLRTLKARELREATMSIFKCANDVEAHFELRKNSLARSIYQIDGEDVDVALGGKEFALKLKLIDDMEEVIVSKLYNEFKMLKNEADEKYGVLNEEQVKEVLQDIKK